MRRGRATRPASGLDLWCCARLHARTARPRIAVRSAFRASPGHAAPASRRDAGVATHAEKPSTPIGVQRGGTARIRPARSRKPDLYSYSYSYSEPQPQPQSQSESDEDKDSEPNSDFGPGVGFETGAGLALVSHCMPKRVGSDTRKRDAAAHYTREASARRGNAFGAVTRFGPGFVKHRTAPGRAGVDHHVVPGNDAAGDRCNTTARLARERAHYCKVCFERTHRSIASRTRARGRGLLRQDAPSAESRSDAVGRCRSRANHAGRVAHFGRAKKSHPWVASCSGPAMELQVDSLGQQPMLLLAAIPA